MLRLRGGVIEPALMELARSYNTEKKVCRKSVRQQTDGGRTDERRSLARAAERRHTAPLSTGWRIIIEWLSIAMRYANQRGGGGGVAVREHGAMPLCALAAAIAFASGDPCMRWFSIVRFFLLVTHRCTPVATVC